jgi:oligopeptide/dipeptide ABC transporter ATP-binding protein
MAPKPLLELRDFSVAFRTADAELLRAVDRVSFSVAEREITGVVGESGCGKSVMVQSIPRLLEHSEPVEYAGEVFFDGVDLLKQPLMALRSVRGKDIAMIFQDPLASLNPVYTIGEQIVETIQAHNPMPVAEARRSALALLERLGIPDVKTRFNAFPHEFSGGMVQRVMIAMALCGQPRLLIADEPTTALDATIQAQILSLIKDLHQTHNMAVLFISHDLGVIAQLCSLVKVMYLGQIVEEGDTYTIFTRPLHPYTQGLLRSIPPLDGNRDQDLFTIEGTVPSLRDIPAGCRFAPRCSVAAPECRQVEPPVQTVASNHRVKCLRARHG